MHCVPARVVCRPTRMSGRAVRVIGRRRSREGDGIVSPPEKAEQNAPPPEGEEDDQVTDAQLRIDSPPIATAQGMEPAERPDDLEHGADADDPLHEDRALGEAEAPVVEEVPRMVEEAPVVVEEAPQVLEEAPQVVEGAPPPRTAGARGERAVERELVARSDGRGVATPRPLPRVVAVANQKGGVGKTTTTVNLGAALADLGYRVLVIDLDPQGNATTGLGIDARSFEHSMYDVIMRETPLEDAIEPTSVRNLFVAPATIDLAGVEIELVPAFSRELRLRRAIETVVDDFDFVLIDCPPSLGLITINGLAAASEVLVPIQCEYYALEGLGQLLRNVHLVASNLNERLEVSAIVLTMYDARTRLALEVADDVREHFGEKVCRIVIPRTIRLSEAPSFGQPITVFDPSSRGAVAYRELAKEVSNGAPKRTG